MLRRTLGAEGTATACSVSPPARYGPLVPRFGHAEETDTRTQRARGTLTFTLNICCYFQSASVMEKRKKVN